MDRNYFVAGSLFRDGPRVFWPEMRSLSDQIQGRRSQRTYASAFCVLRTSIASLLTVLTWLDETSRKETQGQILNHSECHSPRTELEVNCALWNPFGH